MNQAERRHRSKLHYLTRGRADGLVQTAQLMGWDRGKTFGVGRKLGLDPSDVRAALERAEDCAEEVS